MFPEPLRIHGCLDPSVVSSEPGPAPVVLAETSRRFWIQFDSK